MTLWYHFSPATKRTRLLRRATRSDLHLGHRHLPKKTSTPDAISQIKNSDNHARCFFSDLRNSVLQSLERRKTLNSDPVLERRVAHTHTHTNTYTHLLTQSDTHTQKNTHTTCTHTHTHTHCVTHKHTHAHSLTHTHTCTCLSLFLLKGNKKKH